MNPKVAFLIPAHNEERLIGYALENLKKLKNEFGDVEVLVGLDGCEDATAEIVKKYDFVRCFEFPRRTGKQEVIRFLKQKATAPILMMNDADWQFVANADEMKTFLECFEDPSVGGLGDYFTTSYEPEKVKTAKNLLFLGDAWTTHLSLECKMNDSVVVADGKRYVDVQHLNFMFYVHFFRKDAVDDQVTLCDDGERMIQMVRKGYKVRLLDIEQRPCFKASYDHIGVKGFFRQRMRGFVADRQIKKYYPDFRSGTKMSYVRIIMHVFGNLHRVGRFRAVAGICLWWLIAFAAYFGYYLRRPGDDTSKGWTMRALRWKQQ